MRWQAFKVFCLYQLVAIKIFALIQTLGNKNKDNNDEEVDIKEEKGGFRNYVRQLGTNSVFDCLYLFI